MVKADFTRDYYADLDLPPGADTATIKKQFKKLALTYHPDRNPGRENEVTAKFQNIQSAHEVLTDPQERAKYDSNRLRSSTKHGNAYAGSSGVRGNPWSDVGSQYPPPPKAPTARRPAHQQQASAGAERYKKWEAPKQSAYQAAHEGAGARQKTYEAWESMKTKSQPFGQQSQQSSHGGSTKTSRPPQVPPRGTPQPSQEESFFSRAQQSPPKSSPFYDPDQPGSRPASPPRRSHSTNAFNRKGFMPNTPGGDEPAGPKGAYFTQRNKPAVAPELPSRATPQRPHQSMYPEPPREYAPGMDRQSSQEKPNQSFEVPAPEPRISTPYSTHGGEKLNPFETSHIHRAKSTREPSQWFTADGQIPRTGSDPSLSSPHRSQSFATHGPSKSKHQTKSSVESETDSSDGPELNGRAFGKPRQRPKATNGASAAKATSQVPESPLNPEHHRKPSKISQFRQWYKENPNTEPPLNGFPPDGPPLRSNQSKNDMTTEPSMYANPPSLKSGIKRSATNSTSLPTVSEVISPCKEKTLPPSSYFIFPPAKFPKYSPDPTPVRNSSGITGKRESLTAFEGMQRSMIDQLLHNKRHTSSPSALTSTQLPESRGGNQNQGPNSAKAYAGKIFTEYRESAEAGSPSKKPRSHQSHPSNSYDTSQARCFWTALEKLKANTNSPDIDRFSFNVNDDTFKSSNARRSSATPFSNSTENISTKFSEKDWTGKFEGSEYFKPVAKSSATPSRTQSGSRSRGRSPTKPTIDPRYPQQRGSESESVAESPGGTKFSAQEWADTFRPQTFAPPPPRQVPVRKRTGPTIRPTMGGNATIVDDEENADGKPLFNGRKTPVTPTIPSPDAMDVDLPPPKNTVPQFKPNTTLNVETMSSPKRAAAPSQSPTDEAALKVNFDDLKIQDLLSSLEMPRPPLPPALPENLPGTRPSAAAYEDYQIRFAKYMTAWDLYNNQFMLHLVARKNQNDNLGTKRWLSDDGLEIYRRGLKEDGMVLSRWATEKERHEVVVRDWLVLREQIKEGAAREPTRPKKKTH